VKTTKIRIEPGDGVTVFVDDEPIHCERTIDLECGECEVTVGGVTAKTSIGHLEIRVVSDQQPSQIAQQMIEELDRLRRSSRPVS
jgi:hypothetical protein